MKNAGKKKQATYGAIQSRTQFIAPSSVALSVLTTIATQTMIAVKTTKLPHNRFSLRIEYFSMASDGPMESALPCGNCQKCIFSGSTTGLE
jgi:hypothetical protein